MTSAGTRTGKTTARILSHQPIRPAASQVAPSMAASPAHVSQARAKGDQGNGSATLLRALLALEAGIRDATTVQALAHAVANDARMVTGAKQVFMLLTGCGREALDISAVSALSTVDRNAPLNRLLVEGLTRRHRNGTLDDIATLDIADLELQEAAPSRASSAYPLKHLLWARLPARSGQLLGGIVLARDTAWSQGDAEIAKRIAKTTAHALLALEPRRRTTKSRGVRRVTLAAAGIASAALLAIPVPMTALAPFEVVPKAPFLIASPIDGVIDDVVVPPNADVAAGDILVRFADTVLRNRFIVAERDLAVAEARLRRAEQTAFVDLEGRRDLAVARAERAVRAAERDYAKALLEQSVVRAPRGGIAVFSDRKDLIGRPVGTGERLMEIAETSAFAVRIDVPVADVGVLEVGAPVRLFLDADPLAPVPMRLIQVGSSAESSGMQGLSIRAYAEPAEDSVPTASLRFGARGTAQVLGADVPLGVYLFRRPIVAARQWLGL